MGLINGTTEKIEKPKPTPEPTPEPAPEPTPESSSVDPFEGINDDDIATYSDLFDVPAPENDNEAIKLGNKIRELIKHGRLESDESKVEEEKPKKKRGMFGFGK